MEYRQLGRAGVRVSSLCLGVMNLGGPTPADEGVAIVRAALDAGINFIDTANVYQGGQSEEVVGQALAGRRDEVFLATKVFNPVGEGPNDRGTSRYAVLREVERSLRRLQTDHIDLYQLHRFDEATPLEEVLRALDDLVTSGKVRYIGVSTWPAWRVAQAQGIAERLGIVGLSSEQPPYNLLEREVEKELMPACREFGMAVLPWSPLAGGLLSDRFVGGPPAGESRAGNQFDLAAPRWQPVRDAIDAFAGLAADAGTTLSRFALAWLRDQPGVTSPIIGPRTAEHLADSLAADDIVVDDDQRAAVDAIVAPGTSLWLSTAIADWQAKQAS